MHRYILIIMLLLIVGCRPQRQTSITVATDTISVMEHDTLTILQHDTISVTMVADSIIRHLAADSIKTAAGHIIYRPIISTATYNPSTATQAATIALQTSGHHIDSVAATAEVNTSETTATPTRSRWRLYALLTILLLIGEWFVIKQINRRRYPPD